MDQFSNHSPDYQEDTLNSPALNPPDGVKPNFTNPPNHSDLGLAVIVLCLVLATSTFLMRMYSRIFVMKTMHVEDYLGLVAFGLFLGCAACLLAMLHYTGFFVHQWDIQVKQLLAYSYVSYIYTIIYTQAMLFSKAAIILEWARLFIPRGRRGTFYWLSRLATLLNIIVYTAATLISALSCKPIDKFWKDYLPGTCIDRLALATCLAAFNLAMDIFILVLPQQVIWSLQMEKTRKIGVSIVFSVGLLACGCAITRTILIIQLNYTDDAVYQLTQSFLIAFSEVTCVLLVFYVPAVPRAFVRNNLPSRILSSLRPWTRLGAPRNNRSSRSIFPPTIGDELGNHVYHMTDEEGQALSLAELRLMKAQDRNCNPSVSNIRPAPNALCPSNRAIMVTSQFEQHEEVASKSSAEQSIDRRQHPWVEL
ncbi:hypothetical protein F4805DRAFT_245270 [Annulohypoxylon moriforme]|nr:hypothetical protein F4805DRAFT_245270 [Annulohypoxylon moriforme]